MRRICSIALFALVLGAAAPAAFAVTVTWNIEGTLNGPIPTGLDGVSPGDAFQLVVTFDTALQPDNLQAPVFAHYTVNNGTSATLDATLTFGTYTIGTNQADFGQIIVLDDGAGDKLGVAWTPTLLAGTLSSGLALGTGLSIFEIENVNGGNLITGLDVPEAPPDLGLASRAVIEIPFLVDSTHQQILLKGTITSISVPLEPVPEPASLLLAGLGVLGVAFRRRTARR